MAFLLQDPASAYVEAPADAYTVTSVSPNSITRKSISHSPIFYCFNDLFLPILESVHICYSIENQQSCSERKENKSSSWISNYLILTFHKSNLGHLSLGGIQN